MEIVPSIASANQAYLFDEIHKLDHKSVKSLHMDIEDGNFIPNITFGIKTLSDLRKVTNLPFSVHLMVNNPKRYLCELKKINVKSVAIHIESCDYPKEVINLSKSLGMEVGMAINPRTPIYELEYLLKELDYVLIMTAEPDGKGQEFIHETQAKVSLLSKKISKHQRIWVDGGISEELLYKVYKSGAHIAVLGRAIFGKGNPEDNIERIRRTISEFPTYFDE